MFEQFKKDLKIGGIINIILYIGLNLYIQLYLSTKTSAFSGFKIYHQIIWYSILISQNIYILLILSNPNKYNNKMNKSMYNFFTIGGFNSIKDILIVSEEKPLIEYVLLFIFILIPWPILKKITWKNRFMLIFAKIGIFHFISSLILLNWKTDSVNYNLNLIIDK
tara:strand:- start:1598 stop:2092 length:495 start_codon:yes stop_codon:yes gene_type:complete